MPVRISILFMCDPVEKYLS